MKRPIFLTIWLALLIMASVLNIYSYLENHLIINEPTWSLYLKIIFAIIRIVGIISLFKWRMVGFYLIIGVSIILALIDATVLGIGKTVIYESIGALVSIIVIYLAMKPVRSSFK